jgi:hypothetical protein
MATTTVGGVGMPEAPITADARATEGAAGKADSCRGGRGEAYDLPACLAELATLTADICVPSAGMPG